MKFIKIIILLAAITPFMFILSGCSGDAFLDAMKEEGDFIAPFDVVVSTEEAKRTTYFPIADTATSAPEEDDAITSIVAGDDGSYNDKPRSLNLVVFDNYTTIKGESTNHDIVKDNVTGLWWTKCSAISPDTMDTSDDCSGSKVNIDDLNNSALMEWTKAISTCKNLTYAGHKDWRLPRLPELLSIVNYGYHPAINPKIFPNAQGSSILNINLSGSIDNYTFIVNYFTKERFSVDERPHYEFDFENNITNPPIDKDNPKYTAAKYVKEDGEYVFNENYTEKYKLDESGTLVLQYIPIIDLDSAIPNIRCKANGDLDPTGDFFKVSGVIISRTSNRYNYNTLFGYLPSSTGEFLRAYIPDNEDQFNLVGVNYIPDSNPVLDPENYRRVYMLDTRNHYRLNGSDYVLDNTYGPDADGTGPDGVDIGIYVLGDYGKFFKDNNPHYKFDGEKFVSDPNGRFIQKFDSPIGYWTSSSKLQFDDNFNTADYGWIVFHQGGGTFGVNMASYKLKVKENLSFERQFVRCVRGKSSGDIDDVDFPGAED